MIDAKNAKAVRKAHLAMQPLKMVLLRVIGENQQKPVKNEWGVPIGWKETTATREVYNCCCTYQEDGADVVEVTTTHRKLQQMLQRLAHTAPSLVKVKYSTATGWAAGYIVQSNVWNEFVASHLAADFSDEANEADEAEEGGETDVREA
jgi:hypothetical protein